MLLKYQDSFIILGQYIDSSMLDINSVSLQTRFQIYLIMIGKISMHLTVDEVIIKIALRKIKKELPLNGKVNVWPWSAKKTTPSGNWVETTSSAGGSTEMPSKLHVIGGLIV